MTGELAAPFPQITDLMKQAYLDLRRVESAKDPGEVRDLGPLDQLPRPWDITTCTSAALRTEVWAWLDAVVGWINTQHVWDVTHLIPACWPLHPHLVHDIGVIADQRRRAGLAYTSDALEEWHRYCLPAFFERMRVRSRDFCEDGHRAAPGLARTKRYAAAHHERDQQYTADVEAATPADQITLSGTTRFRIIDGLLIDPHTGEIPR